MEKRTKRLALLLALVLLGMAFISDFISNRDNLGSRIKKGDLGSGDTQLELIVENVDGGEKMPYTLDIKERTLSEQDANELFESVKAEIQQSIYSEGEQADSVYSGIQMKPKYADGKVKASFEITPAGILADDGSVIEENLPENGELLMVEVLLRVQAYECIYQFPIHVLKKELVGKELVMTEIKRSITETDEEILLPEMVEGANLKWFKKKQNNFFKILGLEIIAFFVATIFIRRKEEEARKKEKQQMEYEYPILVNKFALLLGAGMSVKQVWYNISASYADKREKGTIKKHPLYENMIETYYELLDGESEANAYRNFGNRVQIPAFQRLIRLLNQSNRRGSHGISELLESESQRAFSERIHVARELGEKAQTRLLLPLLLMMLVVFVVVITPAMLQFMG